MWQGKKLGLYQKEFFGTLLREVVPNSAQSLSYRILNGPSGGKEDCFFSCVDTEGSWNLIDPLPLLIWTGSTSVPSISLAKKFSYSVKTVVGKLSLKRVKALFFGVSPCGNQIKLKELLFFHVEWAILPAPPCLSHWASFSQKVWRECHIHIRFRFRSRS